MRIHLAQRAYSELSHYHIYSAACTERAVPCHDLWGRSGDSFAYVTRLQGSADFFLRLFENCQLCWEYFVHQLSFVVCVQNDVHLDLFISEHHHFQWQAELDSEYKYVTIYTITTNMTILRSADIMCIVQCAMYNVHTTMTWPTGKYSIRLDGDYKGRHARPARNS